MSASFLRPKWVLVKRKLANSLAGGKRQTILRIAKGITMEITINRRTILWGLIFVGGVAFQIFVFRLWLHTPPSKASQLKPLLKEIESFKAAHGQYPNSGQQFSSFTNLIRKFSVYTGEQTTNGVDCDIFKLDKHDFTFLLEPKGYVVYLPVGRMKMMSFTSFPVWRLDSAEHRWQKGRIHWYVGGSYWSE